MTQPTPNTQGASWERFDEELARWLGEQYILGNNTHDSKTIPLAFLEHWASKERAEGERRERERILAALPKDHACTNCGYDFEFHKTFEGGGSFMAVPCGGRKSYRTDYEDRVRKIITTLPADSTESV